MRVMVAAAAAGPTSLPPLPPPLSTFSVGALLVLLVVVGLSSAVFAVLVRRATSHRRAVEFADWGRRKGFRLRRHDPAEDPPPPPFERLGAGARAPPAVRFLLVGRRRRTFLMQLERGPVTATDPVAGSRTPIHPTRLADAPPAWNLLVRRLAGRNSDWPPTALRPAGQTSSAVDLFSLASFPTMLSPDRFTAFGSDSAVARALARSPVTGLLPPDVGLLLHGPWLCLDFSSRPFDTIEFDRMLALADQVAQFLPKR